MSVNDDATAPAPPMKLCFVTTGATAPFTALIESVLQPATLDALLSHSYTHLLIQHGTAEPVYTTHLATAAAHLHAAGQEKALLINGFDFAPSALQAEFKLVQQTNGLVISHAGSGTILAALRYHFPLVVVPNTQLLANHQEELAVALESHNYLVRGDVENLVLAIEKAELFREKMARFPPVTSGEHRETKSFGAIMDETLGYMD